MTWDYKQGNTPWRRNELSSFCVSYRPWITWWPSFIGDNFSQQGWGPEFKLGCHLMKLPRAFKWRQSPAGFPWARCIPHLTQFPFLRQRCLKLSNVGKLILTEWPSLFSIALVLGSAAFLVRLVMSCLPLSPPSEPTNMTKLTRPQQHPEDAPAQRHQKYHAMPCFRRSSSGTREIINASQILLPRPAGVAERDSAVKWIRILHQGLAFKVSSWVGESGQSLRSFLVLTFYDMYRVTEKDAFLLLPDIDSDGSLLSPLSNE